MQDYIQKIGVSLTLALMLAYTPDIFSEVYKTVDEDGNVVYTDQSPSPGAEPLELPGLSVISPQLPSVRTPAARQTPVRPKPGDGTGEVKLSLGDLKRGYRDFAIVSPIQDQVFVGAEDAISWVSWQTRYELREGMTVTVYLNGQAQTPTTATTIELGWLARGTHEVYAVLTDARNRQIASTDPVSFHVRRNSINFQNRQSPGG